MTVKEIRERLRNQIAAPVFTEDMTGAECQAEINRYLAERQAQSKRLDEENLILGLGWSASVYLTHEITGDWLTATADRWFRALPERYMTPDSMCRPDWDHSHYPHDEHGRIGRVTTKQRPETEADTQAEQMVARILAEIAEEEGS